MNINQSFYDRKVRKMGNLGNVYICGLPFVMSRTDAQNGLYRIFIKVLSEVVATDWQLSGAIAKRLKNGGIP